ncbi:ATP-binding region, ATPase-like:Histidine kinase, HAMP region:Histidine kinase A, N-terminal [Magnetospirillum sp. LM-5]|uniref:sensor histidine kinase n=1 Tax=Magnetospirillum sp. LM-5 TaxID=2681466 RepID=UPI00137CC866|nr:HAMP domain-containing sensor histidine kinase [Magnetospirillum sp. LM-5]CAA7614494.1 ATP-binding region, ATPase-like:Histidine kinase, HAMP region:Histidine kinase A, N-terminal [Magnetospirillum sp. LM-5]
MSWLSSFRTTTFRMVALAAGVFAVLGLVLILVLSFLLETVSDQRFDRVAATSAQAVLAAQERGGFNALRAEVADRAARTSPSLRLYLLEDPSGTVVAGNLPTWPRDLAHQAGSATIGVDQDGILVARVSTIPVAGGGFLLVGTPIPERQRIMNLEIEALAVMAGLMALIGTAAGLVIAKRVLGRLDVVNRTASTILAGNLAQRVPVSGRGDEFDSLAANINIMLDRIEGLLATVHSVTHNIAHDLRAPLNRLRGRLELALMTQRSPDDYQQALAAAITEADEIINTFNAMLAIARLEGGASGARSDPVDVSELVECLADLYQPLAEENDLTLAVEVLAGQWIRGDRHLLSQALSNLVDNAIKYSPPGGRLHLGVERVGDWVRLSVKDDGPGIAADQRQAVLQPFVRLDPARSTPGSGLGLSLVAAVAEFHNARLTLADNQPGLAVFIDCPVSSAPR